MESGKNRGLLQRCKRIQEKTTEENGYVTEQEHERQWKRETKSRLILLQLGKGISQCLITAGHVAPSSKIKKERTKSKRQRERKNEVEIEKEERMENLDC